MRLIEIKQLDGEQLDETHPMTRMMLNAMGDRNPEATIKKHKDEAKKRKAAKKKKVAEGEEQGSEKCRGCGQPDDGSVAFIGDLCKECAKDTYEDRD